ncbi:hypothetical protein U9M48_041980 [Paspalum notatum var. saurae]|uniref:RING-type E3 ubiquitin transferase n=1 Tax=Paspalum notatum var. saurae TaxID=547442 RepID=A0AAQ3XFG8_PASNO
MGPATGPVAKRPKRGRPPQSVKPEAVPSPASASPGSAAGAGNTEKKGSPGQRPVSTAVGLEDPGALECGSCSLPLKPEIYQCSEGHVVCSPCRDKLAPAGKCHVCGIATDLHRCHAMERLVKSIRIPCPNAAHGCGARLAYCDLDGHHQTCPHAPHRCPGKDCGFLGSTEALMDHFTGAHGWPSTTKISAFETHDICLYDGFNFLFAYCAEDDDHGTTTTATTTTTSRYLFLLNVTRQPFSCAITVHFIGRRSPSEVLRCVLSYSRVVYDPLEQQKFLVSHSLKSEINVECMDISNGLPGAANCFPFVVPNSGLGDHDKKDPIRLKACINIIS